MADHAVPSRVRRAAWLALLALAWGAVASARAQQVVLLDHTLTLARGTPNLLKSEYTVLAQDFANASPANLRAPVNYAEGRIHVRLEVLSKPSAADTLFTLCIHNDSHQTCIRYLPKFTAAGVYEYDQPMLGQYNYDVYDFAKPVTRVIVAFKDGMERLLDPSDAAFDAFFPTRFRVTMALVAKDADYVPPVSPPRDAGMDAPDAGQSGGSTDAGMATEDAGAPAHADAATGAGATAAIVDQQLVATAQLADDAKIPLSLTPQTPESLRMPVDFGAGKLHARVEVRRKPSGAPTQLRACIENSASAVLCSAPLGGQSYVSESAIEHEQTLASMQSSSSYDFSRPLRRAYLQMTDAFGASVAGNAQFFPTELKATFTLLGPGASYVPPWLARPDAGSADASAGPAPAEEPSSPGLEGGVARDAGPRADAGVEPEREAEAGWSESDEQNDAEDTDGGCRLSSSDDLRAWVTLCWLGLALAFARRAPTTRA